MVVDGFPTRRTSCRLAELKRAPNTIACWQARSPNYALAFVLKTGHCAITRNTSAPRGGPPKKPALTAGAELTNDGPFGRLEAPTAKNPRDVEIAENYAACKRANS